MDYLELRIQCDPDYSEMLMAELSLLPFESFLEEPPYLTGYIPEELLDQSVLDEILQRYESNILDSDLKKVKRENWNKEWEKNYDPIVVDEKVVVAASFHALEKEYDHKLIIDPRMSFGTGHHETTHQMISNMLQMDFDAKRVLDAGCGTGVLAIFAEKLGASKIKAIDIDEWAVENSIDNVQVNHCHSIDISQGKVDMLQEKYEIILANINKNVLLEESKTYSELLEHNGYLLLSGFYVSDQKDLKSCFESLGMNLVSSTARKDWSSMLFFNP